MTRHEERLTELFARAERERQELSAAVVEVRRQVEQKRARWSSFGFWAGALMAGATSAYKLFGRNSFSSRLGRWSTGSSILIAVVRFLFRLFR